MFGAYALMPFSNFITAAIWFDDVVIVEVDAPAIVLNHMSYYYYLEINTNFILQYVWPRLFLYYFNVFLIVVFIIIFSCITPINESCAHKLVGSNVHITHHTHKWWYIKIKLNERVLKFREGFSLQRLILASRRFMKQTHKRYVLYPYQAL